MRKMLLLALGLSFGMLQAQNQTETFPILFKTGTINPSEVKTGPETLYDGYTYVIVQHPSLVLRADFHGFETFEYLPKHSAFARVKSSLLENAKSQLLKAGGTILNIDNAWKQSQLLYTANYPEWAWSEDEQKLIIWIQYWKGLDALQMVSELQSASYPILQVIADDEKIQLEVDPENLDKLISLPFIKYVEEKYAPGEPENFTARTNHRINYLQGGNLGLNYDGSGIMVAHNDAGEIDYHIDFQGRFNQNANGGAGSDHGDHTAGTITGAGNRDPRGAGMAPGADMFYRNYPDNLNDADNVYSTINARLTSNSFSNGCNGGYSTWSQQLDKDAFDNPLMLHIFSSGNNGNSSCAVNYGAGVGWGNITGGHKQAKNVVTVGNLSRTDGLNSSSSRGPASDGRIKPDICAVGTSVYSTTDDNGPSSYNTKTGTSMSCPGVAGTLAVLMQAYKDINNGTEADGALLKGIIQNTAEDLGNPGPDFLFGYGRINANRAYEVISAGSFASDSLANNDSASFSFTIPANTVSAKFMVIWADPQASPNASRDLVNDLDMTVEFEGSTYQPWVLNPTPTVSALNSNATRGRDSLNNMEQVTFLNPSAAAATVKIKGHNIPSGTQKFYVIAAYEKDELIVTFPTSGDAFELGTSQIIRFDSPVNTSYTAEFSLDGGINWFNIGTTSGSNRQILWNTPAITIPSNDVYIRVLTSNDTVSVGPLTLVQVPANMSVISSCPDSISLTWVPAAGASGYVVYQLGAKYMDSITYSTKDTVTIAHNPALVDWFAVAAVVSDTSVGERSVAIFKSPGISNCVLPSDLSLEMVLSPGFGELQDCSVNSSSDRVGLLVKNVGLNPINSLDLSYQSSTGSATFTETLNRTLASGDTAHYFFKNSRITLLNNVYLNYNFWIDANVDANGFNDTLNLSIRKVNAGIASKPLPYYQDFETFNLCADNADCNITTCNLSDGWENGQNLGSDLIDWRTFEGSTFSQGTGPARDNNPGTSVGNYLYLEASGGCDSAEALLITPCLDLSGTLDPRASIYYHMLGSDMGTLNVDVYDGTIWHINVVNTISGDQGANWNRLEIDLNPYSGKTVVIRFRGKTGFGFASDLAIDDFSAFDAGTTTLSEDNWTEGLRAYPNPSNGVFQLESQLPLSAATNITLRDLSGRTLWSGNFESNAGANSMAINIKDQPQGLYLLEVQSDEFTATLRVVKD
jgi:hypothetical protein